MKTETQTQPGLAYQSVTMTAGNKQYGTELAKAIRKIETYSERELEDKKIVQGGKVNAEALWNYVNILARPMLAGRNFDSKDPNYLAPYLAIKALVEQYGKKGVSSALIERIVATYLNTSTQYVGQKDIQLAGSLPTAEGKDGVKTLAKITGQDVVLGDWIGAANEPSDVANRKNALEEQIRRTVEEAVDRGTLDKIVEQAKADAHKHTN